MTYAIINYMNNDFYRFYNAGTAGAAIDIDSSVFAGWIIGHYQQRNVRYIISHDYNYVILPIRKFAEYFSITASCRIKGSGSSKPAEKDYNFITQAIKQVYKNAVFFQNNKKLYASISEPVYEKRFPIITACFCKYAASVCRKCNSNSFCTINTFSLSAFIDYSKSYRLIAVYIVF